jgi:hypothetical protein
MAAPVLPPGEVGMARNRTITSSTVQSPELECMAHTSVLLYTPAASSDVERLRDLSVTPPHLTQLDGVGWEDAALLPRVIILNRPAEIDHAVGSGQFVGEHLQYIFAQNPVRVVEPGVRCFWHHEGVRVDIRRRVGQYPHQAAWIEPSPSE